MKVLLRILSVLFPGGPISRLRYAVKSGKVVPKGYKAKVVDGPAAKLGTRFRCSTYEERCARALRWERGVDPPNPAGAGAE